MYDIAIAGAGIPGLVLANLLKKKGFNIVLIDAQKNAFDPRISAINLFSERILTQCCPITLRSCFTQINVYSQSSSRCLDFNATQADLSHLGTIQTHTRLKQGLLKAIDGKISFIEAKIVDASSSPDHITLNFEDRSIASIQARLVVAADGASSKLRSLFGIHISQHQPPQRAYVFTARFDAMPSKTCMQLFFQLGVIACLPLGDQRFCVIPSLPKDFDHSDFKAKKSADALLSYTGPMHQASSPHPFTIYEQHAQSYFKKNLALIADAAHCIHPLAGQGLNLGIADAFVLCQCLKRSDPANAIALKRFERKRRHHNALMLKSMSAIRTLFSTPLIPLNRIGVPILNQASFIKAALMHVACGSIHLDQNEIYQAKLRRALSVHLFK